MGAGSERPENLKDAAEAPIDGGVEDDRPYRSLFDSSLDAILLVTGDDAVVDANQTACSLLGHTREELCILRRKDLIVPGPEVDRAVEERDRTGRSSGEVTFRRKDGTTFPGEFTSFTVPGRGSPKKAFLIFRDISERRAAEEALRQSEARLIQAQRCAHIGNWEIDLDAQTIWGSQEAYRIYGLEPEPGPVDLAYAETFILPEDRPHMAAALADLVAGRASYDVEYRMVRPDGTVPLLHSTADLICDPEGRPIKVAGVVQDVTDARDAENRLKLTQYGVDNATDAILWMTGDARLIWVNDSACRILGYSREELLDMTLFDVDTLMDRDVWPEQWERLKHFGPFTFERTMTKKTGEMVPVEVNVGYVAYRGVEYNCSFARDITNRKRAEEEATRLSRIIDDSFDEVYVFDAETLRFVQVNQGAIRNLGYTLDELYDMTPVDLKPAYTLESFEQLVTPLRNGTEEQLIFYTEHRRKDGSLYPVEVRLQLTDLEPRPMFLAIILDITERKAVEEALSVAEERLRQSQKMEAIGQLAGGIAHDFNNILTAILGYSDLLLTGSQGVIQPIRPELEQIKRAAERAGALTRQILAFSRRQALNPQVVSLNDILSGMEPLLRRTLGEHIDVVCELDPDLGLTELDAHQFEQVLMNLAVNALDAMPAGGRLTFSTGNAEIDGKTAALPPELLAGRYVMLTVQDTGMGMDEAIVSRVFEPFFTTKETGKGTGLGLSTVYGTIRQSGGSITVDSRVGEGSRFTLYLPRVFSTMSRQEEPGRPPSESQGGETVMVVEDEVSLQELISTTLVAFGYRVIVAGDGAEALETLARRQDPPDLLLTDVVLPSGLQGHELAERFRKMIPGLPVLFMSGYPRDYIVHEGRLDRGVHFLQKPFTPQQLQAAIRERLAGAT